MRRDQQIRINELLLQREELFLRIHAAETEAARLFGEPFPFTRPVLPSDRRGKRKPGAAPRAAASAPKEAADLLRRLVENESAYRVTYRQFGKVHVETHHEFAALATLLASQVAHLRVLRLETLAGDGEISATLFAAPDAAGDAC